MTLSPNRICNETALNWFLRLRHPIVFVSTGHSALDDLLGDGVPSKNILEIVGDNASGKMQLLMTIAADILLSEDKLDYQLIVLDYNGSFKISRLIEILQNRSPKKLESCTKLLERVSINDTVRTPAELEHYLSLLCNLYSSRDDVIPVLLINKIGTIMFQTTAKVDEEGCFLNQDKILNLMKRYCSNCGTIITTNHLVYWRGYPTPSLGSFWINGISYRIRLEREMNAGGETFFAVVERNNKASERRVFYRIAKNGFGPLSISNF